MRVVEQQKALMKKAIYDAAIAILSQDGFDAMTMERVAEKAGVAKGSLYNYFPNKMELMCFVHMKTIEPMQEAAEAILDRDATALEKLRDIFRTWIEYLDVNRGVFNLLFNDLVIQKLLGPRASSANRRVVQLLARVIEAGIEEGAFRKVDPTQYARLLLGSVREVCDERVAGLEAWPIARMVELILDFFVHGIGAPRVE